MRDTFRNVFALLIGMCAGIWACDADAHSPSAAAATREAPRALGVRKELAAPPRGVIDLKFRDLFKMPVGPRGLEPGEKLLAADGKRVRVVGFMVQQAEARGGFLLSALPTAIGDEDEGLADDLPPGLIRVDLEATVPGVFPHMPGLIQISGVLRLQEHLDPQTQRLTFVQLVPDDATRAALRRVASAKTRRKH